MYKVLIAEDEILVRLGLANSINWEKLNMSLVAQAANGAQAYELFLENEPEILITDIRMPLMNGMELIRKIRENGSSCKIIIITCVEEFEYARQAISYQVEDYILKLSMDIHEIEEILDRIRIKLDASHSPAPIREPSLSSDDACLHQELYDLLCGYSSSASLSSLSISFLEKPLQVAFLRILLTNENMERPASQEKKCTDKTLYPLLKQRLEHDHAILIEKIPGDYFLLFSDLASFCKDFEELSPLTLNYYNSCPVIGISAPIQSPEALSFAANEAQSCISQYFFYPKENLFHAETQKNQEQLKKEILKHIEDTIGTFAPDYPCIRKFEEEYADRIRQFLSNNPADHEYVQKLFYYLADWLQETLNLRNSDPTDNCVYNYRRYIFEASNIFEIYYIFERLLHKMLDFFDRANALSPEMTLVTRYIEQHYSESLTLDDLSAQINYSKGYLCSIFRKELNTSFSNYLAKVRVIHAKQLLSNSFLRLYEIAEQTGFYDYSHFSRTFKKATGFSPQEYQNHQTTDTQEVPL